MLAVSVVNFLCGWAYFLNAYMSQTGVIKVKYKIVENLITSRNSVFVYDYNCINRL